MNSIGRLVPLLVAAIACASFAPGAAAQQDDYAALIAKRAPVLVTVQFVLKTSMGGMMGGMGDQESESEVTGVMIAPDGLVLCSDTQLGGFMKMLANMMPGLGGNISATPTDLKVLVGDDVEGREAELIARDSELDLAWIRIKDPGEEKFRHLDLSKGVKAVVGQRIVAVRRMGKYFGRSPAVVQGRIAGVTTKPRDLYVPPMEFAVAQGLPVYTDDGKLIGVTITQTPDADDSSAGFNPMAMLGQMSSMQDMMMGLILPAQQVAKATKRALASIEPEEEE